MSFVVFLFLKTPCTPRSTLFPYTTLFRSVLVTFNGKSFDWPLLENRFAMTRSIVAPKLAAHRKTVFKRSEEHTSELQSHHDLVCRLLLEKKKEKRLHSNFHQPDAAV